MDAVSRYCPFFFNHIKRAPKQIATSFAPPPRHLTADDNAGWHLLSCAWASECVSVKTKAAEESQLRRSKGLADPLYSWFDLAWKWTEGQWGKNREEGDGEEERRKQPWVALALGSVTDRGCLVVFPAVAKWFCTVILSGLFKQEA